MRDPAGNMQRYGDYLQFEAETAARRSHRLADVGVDMAVKVNVANNSAANAQKVLVREYAYGLPVEALATAAEARVHELAERQLFIRQNGPQFNDAYSSAAPIRAQDRESVGFAAIALLLLKSGDDVKTLASLVQRNPTQRAYLFELLLKAFEPEFSLAKKYKADKYAAPWMDPVLRAIAQPEHERAEALAAHMKNWCRIMRSWGWKPNLDTAPGKDNLFCDFAFEVALAVCAYDIDDSSFSAHPYYPRDLVEYYRANIRHSRDAWRADKAGPGIAVHAPPLPPKAGLDKSKRKGIARWVELVCDGDADATESVLETVGKPRKIKDFTELMGALFENSQAVMADTRDDDTVAISCATLADARGLGDFDAPAGPPFGLTRCTATLLAFSEWVNRRGYRLVDLDNDADAWTAVVVKADYQQELLDLSGELGLAARDPALVYRD